MRKSVVATLVAMMLVVVVVAAAFAQGAGPGAGAGTGTPGAGLCLNGSDLDGDGVCDNWVDANGDGVNDLAPRDGTGNQYGNRGSQRQGATGAGVRANAGQAQGANQGAAFIDQNGDGVCDNYVDADGDGVNDAAPRNGTGNQRGRRGR